MWALRARLLAAVALTAGCNAGAVLGVEYGGDFIHIDAWKGSNAPKNATGGAASVDSSGWPTQDFQVVVFDARPTFAWAPPEDDPQGHAEWLVGTWQMRFAGSADVACHVDPNAGCAWQLSDPVTTGGYTYINLTMPAKGYKPELNLMILNFSNTQRLQDGSGGAGVTNISIVLPNHTFADAPLAVGQKGSTPQFFADWSVSAIMNIPKLSHARFMGAMDTNYQPGFYGDAGHHMIEWSQRALPTDSSWKFSARGSAQKSALPWEVVIHFANYFKKDIWINVPVSASSGCLPYGGKGCWEQSKGTYVAELAQLLKDNLDDSVNIYIEHSNEVWNFGFGQYIWNKLNAADMCQHSPSDPLCSVPCGRSSGPCKNEQTWSERRHMQRVWEITQEFAAVFGADQIKKRIRPIYASWTIQPQGYYNDTLAWLDAAYGKGTASKTLYALSATAYFPFNTTAGPGKFNKSAPLPSDATPEQIVTGFMSGATTVGDDVTQIRAIADAYGLKFASYEAGPGFKVGTKDDLSNVILSQREAGMKDVMKAWYNTFGGPYDILHQFSLAGLWSRFGSWGAADLLSLARDKSPEVPKYLALLEL